MLMIFFSLDAGIEVDGVALGEGHYGLLVCIGAAHEVTGLGIAGFHLAGIVHGVHVKDLHTIELLDSILDFNLVGALVDDKAVTIQNLRGGLVLTTLDAGQLRVGSLLRESGHLFANQRFYYDIHLLNFLNSVFLLLYFVAKTRLISFIEPSETMILAALTMS